MEKMTKNDSIEESATFEISNEVNKKAEKLNPTKVDENESESNNEELAIDSELITPGYGYGV